MSHSSAPPPPNQGGTSGLPAKRRTGEAVAVEDNASTGDVSFHGYLTPNGIPNDYTGQYAYRYRATTACSSRSSFLPTLQYILLFYYYRRTSGKIRYSLPHCIQEYNYTRIYIYILYKIIITFFSLLLKKKHILYTLLGLHALGVKMNKKKLL